MPLSAGTRLGPYEILSALGGGGMGDRARDTRLERDVAIKVQERYPPLVAILGPLLRPSPRWPALAKLMNLPVP
jgi:hypothetical protein